jgi:tetratricopeptide (TPR) repeat protein
MNQSSLGGFTEMSRRTCAVVVTLLLAFGCVAAWPQGFNVRASGTVTQNGAPVENVQVIFSIPDMGKQYKSKTDKRGNYFSAGMAYGTYKVQVIDAKGEVLYTQNGFLIETQDVPLSIDLAKPEASGGMAGDSPDTKGKTAPAAPSKITKEQQKAEAAKVKADNEKIVAMNEYIKQYQVAAQAQNWPDAQKALQQLLAADPTTTRWELYQRLADAQDHNNQQADALRSLDKGIELATAIAAGKAPNDPHNPNADPAKAKTGMGQMLIAEGNIYVKLGSPEMATPLFAQAAQDNPSPALAYYNLCAVDFNSNKLDDAVNACNKSLAADPSRAEAWFLKGSALYKSGKADSGKPAVEALNKYLELDPNGQHANDAKSILQAAAQK